MRLSVVLSENCKEFRESRGMIGDYEVDMKFFSFGCLSFVDVIVCIFS